MDEKVLYIVKKVPMDYVRVQCPINLLAMVQQWHRSVLQETPSPRVSRNYLFCTLGNNFLPT